MIKEWKRLMAAGAVGLGLTAAGLPAEADAAGTKAQAQGPDVLEQEETGSRDTIGQGDLGTAPGTMGMPGMEGGLFGATGALDTLTGEVVDVACYVKQQAGQAGPGEQAPGEEAQARIPESCDAEGIQEGMPVGIKLQGSETVVLAVGENGEPANGMLEPMFGEQITIAGYTWHGGGLNLIEVTETIKRPRQTSRAK